MRKQLTLTLDLDCEDGETVETVRSGEEYHVISGLGRSRNLVARLVPVNPPIPIVQPGKPAVSRFVDRQRQLAQLLATAPPLPAKKRRATKAA